MPISLVAASAMAYWGRFDGTNLLTLPVTGAFQAAGGRQWLVRFWEIDSKWVGIALPFGIILWILFFFDHNVSVSQPGFTVVHTITLMPKFSHSWLKDLNFHFENHRDFITTSSFSESLRSLQASLVYPLRTDSYLRHPFTPRHYSLWVNVKKAQKRVLLALPSIADPQMSIRSQVIVILTLSPRLGMKFLWPS
jgi:hypothetical protein